MTITWGSPDRVSHGPTPEWMPIHHSVFCRRYLTTLFNVNSWFDNNNCDEKWKKKANDEGKGKKRGRWFGEIWKTTYFCFLSQFFGRMPRVFEAQKYFRFFHSREADWKMTKKMKCCDFKLGTERIEGAWLFFFKFVVLSVAWRSSQSKPSCCNSTVCSSLFILTSSSVLNAATTYHHHFLKKYKNWYC